MEGIYIDTTGDHERHLAMVKHHCEIDIPAWQHGTGDWFTVRLFNLMAHADSQNFARLKMVFPDQAAAFEWWQSGAWDEQRRET